MNIDYAPALFEDSVVGGAASDASGRSFGGAGSYGGASSGASSNAYAGAASGVQYNQAGLFGGAGASADSSASAGSFGGAGSFAGSNANSFSSSGAFGSSSAGASAFAQTKTEVRYAAPVIKKNFYYHVAQDDTIAESETNTLTITPRKHYKVIFIKAPSGSCAAALLHATEQQHWKMDNHESGRFDSARMSRPDDCVM